MDCSQPGSSVHGILQARILEWVAISFSRGSSQPRDGSWVSCIAGSFFSIWATKEVSWPGIKLGKFGKGSSKSLSSSGERLCASDKFINQSPGMQECKRKSPWAFLSYQGRLLKWEMIHRMGLVANWRIPSLLGGESLSFNVWLQKGHSDFAHLWQWKHLMSVCPLLCLRWRKWFFLAFWSLNGRTHGIQLECKGTP